MLQIGRGPYILDLSDCNISDTEQGAFNSLYDLISLKLSNNNIKTMRSKMLSSPHLKVLYLDENGLEKIEHDAFDQLRYLQRLYLQHNALQEVSVAFPSSLHVLDISHNRISSITADSNMVRYRNKYYKISDFTFYFCHLRVSSVNVHSSSLYWKSLPVSA
jgi:Leucine-rich repeat (LRR) protein